VRYLLDNGADLHQQRSKGNITLLHSAAAHGIKRRIFLSFLLEKHLAFLQC
jgi:ankyrin repeat protein